MTVLKAIRVDTLLAKTIPDTTVACGCAFCKGQQMRKDVEHYKLILILFTDNATLMPEYYLNIDKANGLVSIEEKL